MSKGKKWREPIRVWKQKPGNEDFRDKGGAHVLRNKYNRGRMRKEVKRTIDEEINEHI